MCRLFQENLADSTVANKPLLTADQLTTDTLAALLEGKLLAIQVPNFESQETCAALSAAAERRVFSSYRKVQPVIDRLGITVFEYYGQGDIGKKAYFKDAALAEAARRDLVGPLNDPVRAVMAKLKRVWSGPVEIAREDRLGAYFAGLFRRMENGALVHIDYAPKEQPGWEVAQVQAQLVWNLYCRAPRRNPGVVRVWNRQYQKADDRFAIPDSYAYDPRVVEGAEYVELHPRTGDLVLINTRCFHAVDEASGPRIACTSAIGQTSSGKLLLWS